MSDIATIQALSDRLDVFLQRLKQRCIEFGEDSKKEVAELRAVGTEESTVSAANLQAAVLRQIAAVGNRAEKEFGQHFAAFDDHDDEDVEEIFNECESRVEAFQDWVENHCDYLFADAEGQAAQDKWDQAMNEFHKIASQFTCSQCGAPVPVDKPYYQATYLSCLGCGTQTTFQPSSLMQELPLLAEDISLASVAEDERRYDELSQDENSANGEPFYVKMQADMKRYDKFYQLLPELAESKEEMFVASLLELARTQPVIYLDPPGYRLTDIAYTNVIGIAARMEQHYAAENKPYMVQIVRRLIEAFARPGDDLAQAALNGTYTEELWERHFAIAETKPKHDLEKDAFESILENLN